MIAATSDDVARVKRDAGAVATRPGSIAWAQGVARDLADNPDRGADRWAREYLRALGWPITDRSRVPRRAHPGAPVLPIGTDWHRMALLEDVERANVTPAAYGVQVRIEDPSGIHAALVRDGLPATLFVLELTS